jgi:hypothetical protein
MQFSWRAMSGPALMAAMALLPVLADHYHKGIPYPAPLFVCIVALAGALSGLASAATSAAIAIGCTSLFLFDRTAPGFDTADLINLSTLSMALGGTAAVTGQLRRQ